jgi:hypothetical protein
MLFTDVTKNTLTFCFKRDFTPQNFNFVTTPSISQQYLVSTKKDGNHADYVDQKTMGQPESQSE